jgi:hypothetical protein
MGKPSGSARFNVTISEENQRLLTELANLSNAPATFHFNKALELYLPRAIEVYKRTAKELSKI